MSAVVKVALEGALMPFKEDVDVWDAVEDGGQIGIAQREEPKEDLTDTDRKFFVAGGLMA